MSVYADVRTECNEKAWSDKLKYGTIPLWAKIFFKSASQLCGMEVTTGTTGTSGTSGTSGKSGTSGTSGTIGTRGVAKKMDRN